MGRGITTIKKSDIFPFIILCTISSPESLIYMGESVASDASALRALCDFEKTDVGATLMGKQIRVDNTGELLSVKDAMMVIEGCSAAAAQMKMLRLLNDGKISEGANSNFTYFKLDDNNAKYVPIFLPAGN